MRDRTGDQLVTLKQLEQLRGVPRRTTTHWISHYGLRAMRTGQGAGATFRLWLSDFDAFVESRMNGQVA